MAQSASAVQGAIRVIRCLAGADSPLAFTAIAEATGVAGANLHRILRDLKVEGAAGEPADERWELTPEFMARAARGLNLQFDRLATNLLRLLDGHRDNVERP